MLELATEPGKIFPNPPLKEATFEVRFNPLLKIERDLARFQESITAQYPLLGKEPVMTDGGPRDTFLFNTEDKKKTMRVSVGSFALSVVDYKGFEPFRNEITEKAELFCRCYEIQDFKRVGLRYINNIEVEAFGEVFNFSEFVHPLIDVNRVSPREIRRLAMEITVQKDIGFLTIRTGLMPLPLPLAHTKKAVYVLDFDFYTEQPQTLSQVPSLLQGFHDHIEREFLGQITKSLVALMEKERP